MHFYALVEERPGESVVFFRALPGCFSSASTTAEALQKAPEAIERYLRWLKTNEIALFEEEVTSIDVVRQECLASRDASIGPCFEADRAAPDDLEIDNALSVTATARALIIELMSKTPAALYEATPMQGDWSLTQHVQQIMEVEAWYVSRLQEQPPSAQPTAPMNMDTISMTFFANAMDHEVLLRDLTPEQRERVFVHEAETWTTAKVLRRLTQHLYERSIWTAEIIQQLSLTK